MIKSSQSHFFFPAVFLATFLTGFLAPAFLAPALLAGAAFLATLLAAFGAAFLVVVLLAAALAIRRNEKLVINFYGEMIDHVSVPEQLAPASPLTPMVRLTVPPPSLLVPALLPTIHSLSSAML